VAATTAHMGKLATTVWWEDLVLTCMSLESSWTNPLKMRMRRSKPCSKEGFPNKQSYVRCSAPTGKMRVVLYFGQGKRKDIVMSSFTLFPREKI